MPAENSIELFNCSLCSYCETSLDGLASHIRKHIKPEPNSELPKETPLHVNTHEINYDHESKAVQNGTQLDANEFSPRIEVLNPRSIALNGTHNANPNDSQKLLISNYKENMPPVSYNRNVVSTPQQPQHMMQQELRVENQPVPQRYVQLHSRDPQYIETNQSYHPYGNQYVTNINGKPTIIHTEMPKNHRNHQSYERERVQRNIAPAPSPTPMHSPTNRISNTDPRSRSNLSYENGHDTNRAYSNVMDNGYRSHNHTSHGMKTQRQPHSAVSPLASPYNMSGHLSPQGSKPDERLKQFHINRLSDIQLNGIPKQQPNSHGNISVPNNGALFLNPEQLMLGNVSTNLLEQLAGLLVVPLKKTRDASCQTDSVYNGTSYSNKQSQNSRSMQTDLHMGQIAENHSKTSPTLFGSFRSTDDLYECLVCGDEFASDYHLQEHTSTVHIYMCDKCFHSSRNLQEHNLHLTECGISETEMVCMECNSIFPSMKKLNLHRSKVHQIRMPFRCGVCSVPFETHESVMQHITTHDNEGLAFKCRYCVKVFQSADGLNKHFTRHERVDILYECRFCKKSFSTHALLTDHISYVHVIREPTNNNEAMFAFGSSGKSEKSQSSNSSNDKKTLKSTIKKYPLCRYCDLAFKNSELLHHHSEKCSKNTDSKVTPFICDVCKEYYPSDLDRKQHLKKDHKRDAGFRCPKCSKIYRTWSRLKFHTKQQHVKKTCPDCSMIFTKDHVLRKHQEEKHGKPQGQPGVRVYTCSLCHTMLSTLTELMNHRKDVHPELSEMRTADQSSNATMLSYIDNINENCVSSDTSVQNGVTSSDLSDTYPSGDIVIKRSPSSEDLKAAVDAEGTDSSLKCLECGLLFEDEKRLKNHKGLIHGEMPFKCDLCPKSFQYSSQVDWHMRTHKSADNKGSGKVSSKIWKAKNKKFPSNVKLTKSTFICQFCGAKFSQEKLLKNHKGSVHKIKLFNCSICDYKCGHSTELIWHERTCRAKFKRKYPDSEFPTKEVKAARIENMEMSDDEPPGGYVCHICDISFTMLEGYQSHMKTHPGEEIPTQDNIGIENVKSIAVNSSNAELSKSSKMDIAELLSIDPEFDQSTGEYVCPVCQKTTRSMTGMKTHYGRVHGVWGESTSHIDKDKPKVVNDAANVWPCQSCDRKFVSLGSLRHHTTVVHGYSVNKDGHEVNQQQGNSGSPMKPSGTPQKPERNVIYSCPYCEVTYTKSKSIRVHAFKKHGTVLTDEIVKEITKELPPGEAPPPNQVLDNIRFKCYKCKSKFRSTKALRVHSIKRHNLVLSKKELQRTKIRIKPSEAIPPPTLTNTENGSVFPCDFCGRVFANHRAYFTHYRQAHRNSSDHISSPRKPSKNEIVNFNPLTSIKTSPGSDKQEVSGTPSTPTSSKVSIKKEDSSSPRVQCPKCEQSFAQVKGLLTHLYAAHQITKEQYPTIFPDGTPTLPTKKAVCSLCDKVCIDIRAMRIHVYKAHGLIHKNITKDAIESISEGDMSDILQDEGEIPESDENKLRVVEAELEPPVCFICGRLFKSRRALMTHEFKYHGIRWVGNKRIFPQQVKNVPKIKNTLDMKVETNIDGIPNSSVSTDYVTSKSNITSDYAGRSHSPVPILDPATCFELCPKCPSRYQNRRALTTHLVRIHKWKKNKLHAYFGQLKNLGSTLSMSVQSPSELNVSIHEEDISNVDLGENNDDITNGVRNDGNSTENSDVKSKINNGSDCDEFIINNVFSNGDNIEKESMELNDDFYDESNDCMYVTPNTDMFCLNGESLLQQHSSTTDKSTFDTIKPSDIEAYQLIGKSDDIPTPTEDPIIGDVLPPVLSSLSESDVANPQTFEES